MDLHVLEHGEHHLPEVRPGQGAHLQQVKECGDDGRLTYNTPRNCSSWHHGQGAFPDVNWLQNAQYVGVKQVLGVDTYHWHGKGNTLVFIYLFYLFY
jgi:hypothetical protein